MCPQAWKSKFAMGSGTACSAMNIEDMSSWADVVDSGDSPAAHFLCELVDCKTGIRVGRSYFLALPGLENHLLPGESKTLQASRRIVCLFIVSCKTENNQIVPNKS